MTVRRLLRCDRGAAAAEMALVLPFLVLIVAAAAEVGYYFYEQNRLVESVRDAARYAGRQPFVEYAACAGAPSAAIVNQTKLIAQKGTLDATAADLLWGWGETGESFTVSMSCDTTVTHAGNTETMGGIYGNNPSGAPTVAVDASLPHRTVFGFIGIPLNLTLNAQQEAAVMGI
ncbi:Flp pilus assembly protein TadG [Sphingomicrobium lutaoense]|uniref:Flp pilus assembly protein TadG n=1 Tax=Sphingomicrobium lutaoense TaxID=515949 RepID=A0A839YWV9_9SPHN|nr:TadE family protein [Sphingomicrobium lutaoense]MBB3764691.1 Flp pilus assembly protein TadG [Sphingomicrobium lutaoense]